MLPSARRERSKFAEEFVVLDSRSTLLSSIAVGVRAIGAQASLEVGIGLAHSHYWLLCIMGTGPVCIIASSTLFISDSVVVGGGGDQRIYFE